MSGQAESHQNEYHDNMVAMLELIWGEGYMAPGGPGNVARLLDGLETRERRILDIGCGIGGPACDMVRRHGARVTGIDLESPLVDRARRRADRYGIADRCDFLVVEPGPLPFDDASFDIVTSAGAVTQTGDKEALLREAHRVLAPGGRIRCYEWMRTDRPYSDAMREWLRLEGLTYALWTLDQYRDLLVATGFEAARTEDATDWYRAESRREYERMRDELWPRMVEVLGQADADHFLQDWRAMVVVIEDGEMKQGYFGGRKPGGDGSDRSGLTEE